MKTLEEVLKIVDNYLEDWFTIVLTSKRGINILLNIEGYGNRELRVRCYFPKKGKFVYFYKGWTTNKKWQKDLMKDLHLKPDVPCWSISSETLNYIDFWLNEAKCIRQELKTYIKEDKMNAAPVMDIKRID